jgi:hypothetical protein
LNADISDDGTSRTGNPEVTELRFTSSFEGFLQLDEDMDGPVAAHPEVDHVVAGGRLLQQPRVGFFILQLYVVICFQTLGPLFLERVPAPVCG